MEESTKKLNQRGFTIIEVVVVVAILGLLAAVVIAWVLPFMNRGRVEASAAETVIVQKAMHEYMLDKELKTIEAQSTPIRIMADSPGVGKYLDTNTGWTYTWDEKGLVIQVDRVR